MCCVSQCFCCVERVTLRSMRGFVMQSIESRPFPDGENLAGVGVLTCFKVWLSDASVPLFMLLYLPAY